MRKGEVNRRGFMQVGALALGGITLPEVLQLRARSSAPEHDTSVIMLYQHGGASQLSLIHISEPTRP